MTGETWLVSVAAGRWQLAGISSAQRAGLRVLALDGDPDAPGLKIADRAMVVDIRNADTVLAAVRETRLAIAGAASFAAEAGIRAVGALRDQFGLPGPGLEILGRLTDKAEQRQAWQDADLPNPGFWRTVTTVAEGLAAIETANVPVIVKPVDSAGSRGVTHVGEDADEHRREIAVETALAGSPSGRAIIEAVLPGIEHTVETFADDTGTHVLAVTAKRKVPNTDNTVANELATLDREATAFAPIAQLACEALEAVGYRQGPGHVEVMYDTVHGPALIEAAGRGAGFMVYERLVPLVSGYDLLTATALQAVGRATPQVPPAASSGVIRFFASRPGQVDAIFGFEEACAEEGVEAGAFVQVGDRTGDARSDGDRLGYVLATGPNPDSARQRADAAERHVRFDISHQD